MASLAYGTIKNNKTKVNFICKSCGEIISEEITTGEWPEYMVGGFCGECGCDGVIADEKSFN